MWRQMCRGDMEVEEYGNYGHEAFVMVLQRFGWPAKVEARLCIICYEQTPLNACKMLST